MSDINSKENVQRMKDALSKHISEFKDNESDIKLDETLFGNSSVNNFINFNTSPRGLMMSGNLAQLLVLDKPEPKIIQSGAEDELIHSLIAIVIREDSEVIKVIKEIGLKIPFHIGVIGFNNEPLADLICPKLSSVNIPSKKMGHHSAEILIDQIEGTNSRIITETLPCDLIIRESSNRKAFLRENKINL